MTSRILSLFVQLLILNCQFNIKQIKALYGQFNRPVQDNEFPTVACIAQYDPTNPINANIMCTGTLISETHVVTVEHCLQNLGNNIALEILHGSGSLMNTMTYYPIWWISFDQWRIALRQEAETLYNDISVIKIFGLSDLHYNGSLLSIHSHLSVLFGRQVHIVGCGRIDDGTLPETMQTTQTNVMDSNDCARKVSAIAGEPLLVPLNYFCSQRLPYALLADGDSGGPVIYRGHFVGINAGISPPLNGQFHIEKVNIHIAMCYYSDFINHLISQQY